MNPPGQLEGDRQIPDSVISRRQIGEILYQHLADIRRREGVDPSKYPAVANDIQYDARRTLYGAEVVARETANLMLPALLTDKKPERSHWILRLLRHSLVAGAIGIAAFAGLRELDAHAARQEQIVQAAQSDILHAMKSAQAVGAQLAEAQHCQLKNINRLLTANACKEAFYEAIGHTITAKNSQIKSTIGPDVITLRIHDNLTRKEQSFRIIEIKHSLTPVELDNLRQTVEAARAVSIQK